MHIHSSLVLSACVDLGSGVEMRLQRTDDLPDSPGVVTGFSVQNTGRADLELLEIVEGPGDPRALVWSVFERELPLTLASGEAFDVWVGVDGTVAMPARQIDWEPSSVRPVQGE